MEPGGGIDEFDFRSEELDLVFAELAGAAESDSATAGQASGSGLPRGTGDTLRRAREALARGQLDLATALAQEALPVDEERIEGLVLLGDVFLRRQLAGEALERYQAALAEVGAEGSPHTEDFERLHRDALLGMTKALLMLGRVAEARDGAEELCELLPGNADALRILGQVLARAGQFDRAVEILERGRAVAEADVEIATDLGLAYLETGNLAEAETELRRALGCDKLSVAAHFALGRVLDRAGRDEEAVETYRAALTLLPSYGEVALALAEVERRRGRYEAAIGVQVDLLTLDPYHLDILCQLGSVLLEAGREGDAGFAFRRVLRLDPDHEGARQGLELADSAMAGS